jgi:hypothetical protein
MGFPEASRGSLAQLISKPVLHIKRTHENNFDNVCSRFSRNCIVSPSKLGLSFSIISLTNYF